jgi:3-deoxy-D-manno-octulosonic-acid transferase
MYQIYRFLSWLIYPLVIVLLYLRMIKGKEDKQRFKEKLGRYKIMRPKGKLIWFHTASIGEFNAMLPIINFLALKNQILVTTVTITAAKIAQGNLPENAIHQYMPLDSIICVKRFLKHWEPDLIIWTESEIWPNIILTSKVNKILVNARISARSFKKWQYCKNFAQTILNSFTLILAQSKETQQYIEALGGSSEYLGNLKFVANNFSYNEVELAAMQEQLKNRKVLMLASSHPGEEEMFKLVHNEVKQQHPQLLTIIAPRHPNRINEVMQSLTGLNIALRSKKDTINSDTDILLVDTLGEFGLFFRISNIVCTGGSWKKIAHSFLEAAKLGKLILVGPNVSNSREVCENFINEKAAIFAQNEQEIVKIVNDYLNNPDDFNLYSHNAEILIEEMGQVKEKIIAKILPFVDKL